MKHLVLKDKYGLLLMYVKKFHSGKSVENKVGGKRRSRIIRQETTAVFQADDNGLHSSGDSREKYTRLIK